MKRKNRKPVMYRRALLLFMCVFLLVTMLSVLFLSMNALSRTEAAERYAHNSADVARTENELQWFFENARQTLLNFQSLPEIKSVLASAEPYSLAGINARRELIRVFDQMIKPFPALFGVLIVRPNGEIAGVLGEHTRLTNFYRLRIAQDETLAAALQNQDTDFPVWTTRWTDADFSLDSKYWSKKGTSLILGIAPLTRASAPGIPTGDPGTYGQILLALRKDAIQPFIAPLPETGETVFLLADDDGSVIACVPEAQGTAPVQALTALSAGQTEGYAQIVWEGKQQNVFFSRLPSRGWTLYRLIPQSQLRQKRLERMMPVIWVISAALLLMLGVVWLWSRRAFQPLENLAGRIQKVRLDSLQLERVPARYAEEEMIQDTLSSMLDTFRATLADRRRLVNEALQLEIQNLQAFINPHFLYNTISAMRFLAQGQQNNALDGALIELAQMMRPVFHHSSRPIWTLREELDCLQHYCRLMNIRMGGSVVYALSVPPEWNELPVPCFLLQPVFENCFYHGSREDAPLHIRFSICEREGRVDLTVVNDGLPMPPERVRFLNRLFELQRTPGGADERAVRRLLEENGEKSAGFGLSFLNRRIYLCYGMDPACGLWFRASEDGPVEVHITILREPSPLIDAKNDDNGNQTA